MNETIAIGMPDSVRLGDQLDDVAKQVSPGEWQARIDLAAMYRLAAHYRWTDSIYTHISLRVPGEHAFLINPFGYMYDEVTASSLVKIDAEGNILLDPTGFGINWAGYIIHGAIHEAREDVACVMHTHTRAGAGVSAQIHGLLPISQHAAVFMGNLAYHDFEGVAFRKDEQARLVADLGDHYVMILRNHGLLTAGRSAAEAFCLMHVLERACDIQVAALTAGDENVGRITQASIDECTTAVASAKGNYARDWAALLRLADRVAPDFRN